jgi:hypothetical protein
MLSPGGNLPEDVWRKRYSFLLGLTWVHAVIIALVGPVLGYSWELSPGAFFRDGTVLHTMLEGSIVAVFCLAGRIEPLQSNLTGIGDCHRTDELIRYPRALIGRLY